MGVATTKANSNCSIDAPSNNLHWLEIKEWVAPELNNTVTNPRGKRKVPDNSSSDASSFSLVSANTQAGAVFCWGFPRFATPAPVLGGTSGPPLLGQSRAKWPNFLQWKHAPDFARHSSPRWFFWQWGHVFTCPISTFPWATNFFIGGCPREVLPCDGGHFFRRS